MTEEPGAHRVLPYLFPTEGLLAELPPRLPAAVHARTGLFCYDTMTLIGAGTWENGRGAGTDATVNIPLAPGSGDDPWLAALDRLCAAVGEHRSSAVVVSLRSAFRPCWYRRAATTSTAWAAW